MEIFRAKFLIISFFLFTCFLAGQEIDLDEAISNQLQKQQNQQSLQTGKSEELFNYQDNSIKQFGELERLAEEKRWMQEQLEARRALATELCLLDQKACYLIDNYNLYAQNKENPKTISELKFFGADLFSGYPLNFELIDNTQTEDSYEMGVGDILTLNITGPDPALHDLAINRDGAINIPNFGSIEIAGLSYSQAMEKINDFIESISFGNRASFTLKKLKNITVTVGGSTRYPGTYKISSQSSILNLIAAVGGVYGAPSLRNIKVTSLNGDTRYEDLYDFLIFGDHKRKEYLRNGDTVNIPSTESIVYVLGNINRPAIYEIIDGDTTENLLKMGLGLKPNSSSNISILRLDGDRYITKQITRDKSFPLIPGDVVFINTVEIEQSDGVELVGAIKNPGFYELSSPATFSEIINIDKEIIRNTYLPFFLIKRHDLKSNTDKFITGNLVNIDSLSKTIINPKDKIFFFSKDDINYLNSSNVSTFFDLAVKRISKASPIYDNFMVAQRGDFNNSFSTSDSTASRLDNLAGTIDNQITQLRNELGDIQELFNDPTPPQGKVSFSRDKCLAGLSIYLSESNAKEGYQKTSAHFSKSLTTCTDLLAKHPFLIKILVENSINIFGDISKEGIYPVDGIQDANILFRIVEDKAEISEYSLSSIQPSSWIDQNKSLLDFQKLEYLDFKRINKGPLSRFIHLSGEFVNPGTYPINDGDTITDLYKRAGGLKDTAYPSGAIFTRDFLKKEEVKTLKIFRNSLSEVLTNSIANGYLRQNPTDLISLLDVMAQASSVTVSGRLVTKLDPAIEGSSYDIPVLDGDHIYMPKRTNSINISGHVLNPSTLLYKPSFSIMDYIDQSGGLKDGSDDSSIYVINPNGESFKLANNSFLSFKDKNEILPGATIVVPRKARNLDALGLIENIAPTLASLSVTAASIAAINN